MTCLFRSLFDLYCIFTGILLLVFQFACTSCTVNGPSARAASNKSDENYIVEEYVRDLEVPWALAFLDDGRLFITERPGRIRIVDKNKLLSEPLVTLTDVYAEGEAGLMGLALHPKFSINNFLYVCYTTKNTKIEVKVVRMRVDGTGVAAQKTILDGIPGADVHVGCRLRFGPDDKLYVTTGDAAERAYAQQLDSLAGKTLRLNDDGSIPDDNPFAAPARREIWSLGHRNAQGIDFQPTSGLMFQTEHGPSGFDGGYGGDEINIVRRGENLGWPLVHHREKKDGYISPLLEYTPAVAPAGAAFYPNDLNKKFAGNFFFACLKGERVIRVVLDGNNVVSEENLFTNRFGRIRDVAFGPDGYLYFATSNRDGRGQINPNDDKILRVNLTPQ